MYEQPVACILCNTLFPVKPVSSYVHPINCLLPVSLNLLLPVSFYQYPVEQPVTCIMLPYMYLENSLYPVIIVL